MTILAALGSTACDSKKPKPTGPSEPPAPSFVRLQSEPGDYIGAGQSYRYSKADAILNVTDSAGHLSISVSGDEAWTGDFQLPSGTAQFRRGSYTDLKAYGFHDPAKGGLSWVGQGRRCWVTTGSFTIDSVTYVGDEMAAIDFRFEQRCQDATAALRGTVHWRADDKTVAAGPVMPIPPGLWQPPNGAVPATGDYVYLKSDDGDYIGAGKTYLYAPPATTFTTFLGDGLVIFTGGNWRGDFKAMNSLTQFKPGYYAGVRRYPFNNLTKGGLDWGGQGRACNMLSGWFAVDQVTYVGNALASIELRFEQHCEDQAPALHGAIRWTKPA